MFIILSATRLFRNLWTAIHFRLAPSGAIFFTAFSFSLLSRLTEKRLLVKTVGGESRFIERHSERRGVGFQLNMIDEETLRPDTLGDTEGHRTGPERAR